MSEKLLGGKPPKCGEYIGRMLRRLRVGERAKPGPYLYGLPPSEREWLVGSCRSTVIVCRRRNHAQHAYPSHAFWCVLTWHGLATGALAMFLSRSDPTEATPVFSMFVCSFVPLAIALYNWSFTRIRS